MSVARTKPRSRRINAWRDKKKRKGREEERNRVCIYIYGQWNILYLPLYLSPNGIESRHCWETTDVEEEADKENKKKKKNKRNKRDKCSERFLGTYWRTIKRFIRWINQRNHPSRLASEIPFRFDEPSHLLVLKSMDPIRSVASSFARLLDWFDFWEF